MKRFWDVADMDTAEQSAWLHALFHSQEEGWALPGLQDTLTQMLQKEWKKNIPIVLSYEDRHMDQTTDF